MFSTRKQRRSTSQVAQLCEVKTFINGAFSVGIVAGRWLQNFETKCNLLLQSKKPECITIFYIYYTPEKKNS
jgi:hypothetical protein